MNKRILYFVVAACLLWLAPVSSVFVAQEVTRLTTYENRLDVAYLTRFDVGGVNLATFAFNRDGSRIAGISGFRDVVVVLDAQTGEEKQRYNGRAGTNYIAYSADDRYLVFLTQDNQVTVLDAETLELLHNIAYGNDKGFPVGLVVTHTTAFMLTTTGNAAYLSSYDLLQGVEQASIQPFDGFAGAVHSLQVLDAEQNLVGLYGEAQDNTPSFVTFDALLVEQARQRSRYTNAISISETLLLTSTRRVGERDFVYDLLTQEAFDTPTRRITTDLCYGGVYLHDVDSEGRIASVYSTNLDGCPAYLIDIQGGSVLFTLETDKEARVFDAKISPDGKRWYVLRRDWGFDVYTLALSQQAFTPDDMPTLAGGTIAVCEAITLNTEVIGALESFEFVGMNQAVADRVAQIRFEGEDFAYPLMIKNVDGKAVANAPLHPTRPFADNVATITLLADATQYDFNNCRPLSLTIRGLSQEGSDGAYAEALSALEQYLRHLAQLANTTPEALSQSINASPDEQAIALAWQTFQELRNAPLGTEETVLFDAVAGKLNMADNLRALITLTEEPLLPVELTRQLRPAQYLSVSPALARNTVITLTAEEMKAYFEKGYQANYALSGDVIKQGWDSATQASIVLSFHPVTAPVAGKIGLVTYSAQLPFKVAAALLPSSIKAVDWGYTSVIENEDDTKGGIWQDIVVTATSQTLSLSPLVIDGVLNVVGTFSKLIPPKLGAVLGKSNEICSADAACNTNYPLVQLGPILYKADFSDPNDHTATITPRPDDAIRLDNMVERGFEAVRAGKSNLRVTTVGLRTLGGSISGVQSGDVVVRAIDVKITPVTQRAREGEEVCFTISINNAELKSGAVIVEGAAGTLLVETFNDADGQVVCVTTPQLTKVAFTDWLDCKTPPVVLPEAYDIEVTALTERGARAGRTPPRVGYGGIIVTRDVTPNMTLPPKPSECDEEEPEEEPSLQCTYTGEPIAGTWSIVVDATQFSSTCPTFFTENLPSQVGAISGVGTIVISENESFGDALSRAFAGTPFVVRQSSNRCLHSATQIIPNAAGIQYNFAVSPTVIEGNLTLDLPNIDGTRCRVVIPMLLQQLGN